MDNLIEMDVKLEVSGVNVEKPIEFSSEFTISRWAWLLAVNTLAVVVAFYWL
jgi:hypothetical protein